MELRHAPDTPRITSLNRLRDRLLPIVRAQPGYYDFAFCPEDIELSGHVEFKKRLRALEKEVALSGLKLRYQSLGTHRQLFKRVVSCTSMDEETQGPENMLVMDFSKFWSSAGSDSSSMTETVVLELESPLCLVRGIQLGLFRAYFQNGLPIYPPVAISVSIGIEPSRLRRVITLSVACTDQLQGFLFPQWEVGRYMKVEFLGARQQQLHDLRYYIVVKNLFAVGCVLDAGETLRRISTVLCPASGCEHVEHMSDAEFFVSLFRRSPSRKANS